LARFPERRVNFDYWVLACGIDRALIVVSSEIASPMAVGFRKPAVVIPETLLNDFTEKELDHVILHELAHIARRDDWTNLFARVIGALLPIHPVAVWVVKRIELDREIACDDWVVAVTGEARPTPRA
jgi:beta-lactamase regulating signal transducer with metallopeptidase domain